MLMNWVIIGASNALMQNRRQAITQTNDAALRIGHLGTHLTQNSAAKKM